MERNKNNYPIVKTEEDFVEAISANEPYVSAICIKCGDDYTCYYPLAKKIITEGCICCQDDGILIVEHSENLVNEKINIEDSTIDFWLSDHPIRNVKAWLDNQIKKGATKLSVEIGTGSYRDVDEIRLCTDLPPKSEKELIISKGVQPHTDETIFPVNIKVCPRCNFTLRYFRIDGVKTMDPNGYYSVFCAKCNQYNRTETK